MTKQKFGLAADKETNFSEWYTQVITKGEMLDYYRKIPGCYIMRPQSQFIWRCIQQWFTRKIEEFGVQECYFPMLIPKSMLEKEKEHLENFSPEVAWITKCGNEVLEDPVAIRPTSETIIYPSFAEWIKSHRDLPLKVNQWCSVLRWELHGTLPFIRGKEFLWQEGHTAFLTKRESDEEVLTILGLYAEIYSELLAVPVIKGRKSNNERFGGADYTTSIEAFIPGSGRGVQAGTSHSLGQNFAKMFDIKVNTEGSDTATTFVYQNSWGVTTRSIGIAVMIHSDNLGLVLPPRVAMIQVVIIPCGVTVTSSPEEIKRLDIYIKEIHDQLNASKIRVHIDNRDNVTPGFKFNHWEIRGVPLRLEVGFRDMSSSEACLVRRDYKERKRQISVKNISGTITEEINTMHNDMLRKATAERDSRISYVKNFKEFMNALDNKNIIMAPWCNDGSCEIEIKAKSSKVGSDGSPISGAKTLCIPYDSDSCEGMTCVNCDKQAVHYTLFGRSY